MWNVVVQVVLNIRLSAASIEESAHKCHLNILSFSSLYFLYPEAPNANSYG